MKPRLAFHGCAGGCLAAVLLAAAAARAKTPELRIWLKTGTTVEQQKKEQIERLAAAYDLKKFTLTREVMVDEGARAHSKPVLTLNGRYLENDDAALSVYLHEQAHWALARYRGPALRQLFQDLKAAFPGLPVDPPQGSGDERDSYLHLAVIMLEWEALEALIGPERAKAVEELKQTVHYTALFRTVLDNRARVEGLLARHHVRW
jgi:hypothetical protein